MTDDNGLPLNWTPAARREFLEHELKQKAADEARDWKTKELQTLRRRVHQLEYQVSLMPDAVGQAVMNLINRAFKENAPLSYRGTWQVDLEYARNTLITFDGAMWLSLGTPTKGSKPKSDPIWRMVVKAPPSGGFA